MSNTENNHPWYSEEAGFFSEWYFGVVGIRPKDEKAPLECDFLEKILKLEKGAKILDLCCGHGRITNELAKRGYNMTGQDINGYFLNIAKKKVDEVNLNIHWVKSDMREVPFENKFDAVINMFTSFGFLGSDDEDEKVIAQTSKALKKGGKFVMDYVNKDFIIRNYLAEDIKELDNGYVKIKRTYDFIKCSHIDSYEIFIDNKPVTSYLCDFRFYSVTELTAMLRRNGFRILDVYGSFDLSPLSFDCKNCIILAEKV